MRKQLLLGTTALLAGAVAMPDYASAEDPLRLSVRGYKNEYFGLGSIDNDNDRNTGADTGNSSHFSDGEVHFKGETALDNGLTVGVHIELEATQNGDQIDEAYSYVSGNFGKVIVGSENLAPYLTFWGVTAPNVGVPINSGWISIWVPNGGVSTGFRVPMQTTNLELRNDNFGISYLTPRFAGFQFTAGYAPTSGGGGDPKNAPTDEDSENNHVIAVGLNAKESFNGVDLGFAVGYNRAEVSDDADALGADDPQQFKVGGSVGVAGFSIAGSYANEFEGQQSATTTTTITPTLIAGGGGIVLADANGDGIPDTTTATVSALGNSTEGQAWDIGASYGMGPWGVSATWFHGEIEASAAPGDDEVDAIVGAVSYSIGPGITTSFSVIYAQWESELGSAANLDSEGTMGVLGLAIGF